MNRRSFLSALGIAPVAGAAALPAKAETPKQPRFRCPAASLAKDIIINFEDGRYWFERDERAAALADSLERQASSRFRPPQ